MPGPKWFKVWCEACGEESEVYGANTSMSHGRCPKRKQGKPSPEYKRTPPKAAEETGRRAGW